MSSLLPLRVCHLITDLDTGGAERSLVNLITGLDRAEFNNDVVTLIEPGAMVQPLRKIGISVTSLGMQRGRPSLFGLALLIRHLRITRPAILQTWLYHADLIGTVAAWVAGLEKVIWNVRCTDMTRASTEKSIRFPVRVLGLLSGYPDAIIVNSRRGRIDHEALGYRPRAWVDIPNGVDVGRFRPRRSERVALRTQLGLLPHAVTIGFVARYHPMKDVKTFLHAASLFRRNHAEVQFVLCGEGLTPANAALMKIVSDLDLVDCVILLGRQTEMQDIYPVFDLLTLCSIYGEGFPNVLCEAMACGVPCVATDIGDSADIIGNCGVLVPIRNPEALVQGWQKLLEREACGVGECARSRVAAHYDLKKMCDHYRSLYLSLTSNDRCNTN